MIKMEFQDVLNIVMINLVLNRVYYISIIMIHKYNQFMHSVLILRNKISYKIYNNFKIINILYLRINNNK
jgi:hypothetical protein